MQSIGKCCVLAAVGQGMVNRKGVAATMMSALAKANVNIKAIAQVGSAAAAGQAADPLPVALQWLLSAAQMLWAYICCGPT